MPPTITTSHLCDVVARQRSSRVRDRLFALALVLGTALSLGAIHGAAERAAATPSPSATLVASR